MVGMKNNEATLRKALIACARRMNAIGLNHGRAGNVSVRSGKGFLITPSGMAYDDLKPNDIVWMDFGGKVQGARLPSSEWRFHCNILNARGQVNAVIHTHSVHATALACLKKGIPAFHYMVAAAGGADIRCAPYATFGTPALSRNALKALEGRNACLMAHHGVIALGETLDKALNLALEVEKLAEQYCVALTVGKPKNIPAVEMRKIIKKFETYGKQPGDKTG